MLQIIGCNKNCLFTCIRVGVLVLGTVMSSLSEKKRSPVGPERYQKLIEWLKIWGGDEIHLGFFMLQGSDDDCYYHYYKWQSNAELYVDTS